MTSAETRFIRDLAAGTSTTRERAIARAHAVQKEITILRKRLADGLGGAQTAALLASYDAELTRLCQIPGVLAALLAETVAEEPAP